jgi:serine/threonine-protein kinase RsbW
MRRAHLDGRKRFDGRSDQVQAARRFIADAVAGRPAIHEAARQLVGEAATNALRHSASGDDGGCFDVCYELHAGLLRLEVWDAGAPAASRRSERHLNVISGRGLHLFDRLASRWGTTAQAERRLVWFELDFTSTDDVLLGSKRRHPSAARSTGREPHGG